MHTNTSKILLVKYIKNECSDDELKSVFEVLKTEEGISQLKTLLDEQEFIETPISEKEIRSLDRVYEKLKHRISASEEPGRKQIRSPFLKIAASISIIVIIAAGLYMQRGTLLNVISPVQYTIRSATNAPQQLRLSDNSVIWLNANSTLRYPETFRSSGNREVYLDGEAFFEVTPDADRPFIIHSKGVTTQVLGTSFNLRSFRTEKQRDLTVFTGKVLFADSAQSTNSVVVTANQRVLFSDASRTLTKETLPNPENYLAWRDQKITFDQTPLEEAVAILSRTYNVEIRVAEELKQHDINAHFNKEDSIEKIVDLICITIQTRYRKEGDVYILGDTKQ